MQGLIFIPDICGFTNFVNRVNIDLGVSITQDLLNEIMNSNPLKVDLSEIEGDAILYYKIGKPISLAKMFAAFKKISNAFDAKYSSLKALYNIEEDLSLKFIVHYGNINLYDIKGSKKLYGETVIESHRLLKNGSGTSNYILITEDYLKALQQTTSEVLLSGLGLNCHCSDFFTGLRNIGYHFFSCLTNKVTENPLLRA